MTAVFLPKKRRRKKNRQNDVLFVRNGIREMGTNYKCFAKKNIFGGDNIQFIAPKVKKKNMLLL